MTDLQKLRFHTEKFKIVDCSEFTVYPRYCNQQYLKRLVVLARRETGKSPDRRVYDEEGVALSAFDVFCRGVVEGEFDEVNNRQDLWRLLVVITMRKSRDRARAVSAQKRGNGQVLKGLEDLTADDIDRFLSREPDPQLSAKTAENCQQLLLALDDPDLEQSALLKLDGQSRASPPDARISLTQPIRSRTRPGTSGVNSFLRRNPPFLGHRTADELVTWAELLSNQRMAVGGATNNMTSEEWRERWQSFPHRQRQ